MFFSCASSNFTQLFQHPIRVFRWNKTISILFGFGRNIKYLKDFKYPVLKYFNTLWNVCASWIAKAISSAYWNVLLFVVGISRTYTLKRMGAHIDPWGCPLLVRRHLLHQCTLLGMKHYKNILKKCTRSGAIIFVTSS